MTTIEQARQQSTPGYHRSTKNDLAETPHPSWVTGMLGRLTDSWQGVLASPVFTDTANFGVDDAVWRRVVCEFFCVVEAFPKYMGSYLARTTFGVRPGDLLARNWLIGNIRTEAKHAQWFLDWGVGLGLEPSEIIQHRPGPAAAALCEFLWSVSLRGSLVTAFGAVNYAIEGTTGEWTRLVLPAFDNRFGDDPRALKWLSMHAEYDDAHPREALELMKLTARDEDDHRAAEEAVGLSLELFRRAFDSCY
jgi:pyrroloquinoline quinone (PQQ) biosynthesis protein C